MKNQFPDLLRAFIDTLEISEVEAANMMGVFDLRFQQYLDGTLIPGIEPLDNLLTSLSDISGGDSDVIDRLSRHTAMTLVSLYKKDLSSLREDNLLKIIALQETMIEDKDKIIALLEGRQQV